MKPVTAAAKLGIYLPAAPESFRTAPITRADLDGPSLCKTDPFTGGPLYENGIIRMTDAPGIGIHLGLLLAEIRDIGRDAVALGAVLECCHFRFPFYSMAFRPA